jgi:hypothetical protein
MYIFFSRRVVKKPAGPVGTKRQQVEALSREVEALKVSRRYVRYVVGCSFTPFTEAVLCPCTFCYANCHICLPCLLPEIQAKLAEARSAEASAKEECSRLSASLQVRRCASATLWCCSVLLGSWTKLSSPNTEPPCLLSKCTFNYLYPSLPHCPLQERDSELADAQKKISSYAGCLAAAGIDPGLCLLTRLL